MVGRWLGVEPGCANAALRADKPRPEAGAEPPSDGVRRGGVGRRGAAELPERFLERRRRFFLGRGRTGALEAELGLPRDGTGGGRSS